MAKKKTENDPTNKLDEDLGPAAEDGDPPADTAPEHKPAEPGRPSSLNSYYHKCFDLTRYLDKPKLLEIFRPFTELAELIGQLPDSQGRTQALDHLLIAKDAAIRAALPD